jgi:hypothetical protein
MKIKLNLRIILKARKNNKKLAKKTPPENSVMKEVLVRVNAKIIINMISGNQMQIIKSVKFLLKI